MTVSLLFQFCGLSQVCRLNVDQPSRRKRDMLGNVDGPAMFSVATVSTAYANSPPYLISPSSPINIDENSGTIKIPLEAGDPDSDDVRIVVHSGDPPTRGTAEIPGSNVNLADLYYRPCDYCNGDDIVHLVLVEQTDDALETQTQVSINIAPMNNAPKVFIIERGANIFDTLIPTEMLVEQNIETNTAFMEKEILVALYDHDEDDMITVQTTFPDNGGATVNSLVRDITVVEPNCNMSSKELEQTTTNVIEEIKTGVPVTFPVPCGEDVEMFMGRSHGPLSWAITVITYNPNAGYFGKDSLQVSVISSKYFVLVSKCYYSVPLF